MTLESREVLITTPAWMPGDGVGHDVEGMARTLLAEGCKVYVFAPNVSPAYEAWCVSSEKAHKLARKRETILIHHHSVSSPETENILRDAECEVKVQRYHNVTPPIFFEGYDDQWWINCDAGRNITRELCWLSTHVSIPSYYDGRDIVNAGVSSDRIFYLPYFHKLGDFDAVRNDRETQEQLERDRRFKLLFVGRRVNNKGHIHLIRTISSYINKCDSEIVLHIVGASDPALATYDSEIKNEIRARDVGGNVVLHDKLSFSEIAAYFKCCDLFLCMSEHEGFCIPVIEAQYNELPVLAYYEAGVPESLGPTQIGIGDLNYDKYASVIYELKYDAELMGELGRMGRASVKDRFDSERIARQFAGWVEEVAGTSLENVNPVTSKPKLALVVPRYGEGLGGGAEAAARWYAESLAEDFEVTVLTTNARSDLWESALPVNGDRADGEPDRVNVMRFPAARKRDVEKFTDELVHAHNGERTFVEMTAVGGPDCPELARYLEKNADRFDIISAWIYLFNTTRIVADLETKARKVCVPFLHDEPWLYMRGLGETLAEFDKVIYQTEAERSLGAALPYGGAVSSEVLGLGIAEEVAESVWMEDDEAPGCGPFVVYVGRVAPEKGVERLVEQFQKSGDVTGGKLTLVLIGEVGDVAVPMDGRVMITGRLTEREKWWYIKHAKAVINPSVLESFSLILIEAWAMGKPVIVRGDCPATAEQVGRSGGGVTYRNRRELAWALREAENESEMMRELGQNGYIYFRENYTRERLVPRFGDAVKGLTNL